MKLKEISSDSLRVEGKLGSGSFAEVFQAWSSLSPGNSKNTSSSQRRNYALKRMHSNIQSLSDSDFKTAAMKDLICEVHLLSSLPRHPHVIELYGVSDNFWVRPDQGFMVMELMAETLQETLMRCRHRQSSCSDVSAKMGLFSREERRFNKEVKVAQELHRVKNIAVPIGEAMQFLHHHRIIYRDLKPQNVGIDFQGQVRLLDFGLSRKISENKEDRRKLTGCTGALRYMAPEVARHCDYGFPADVHSFAILLWEICTLKKPYASVPTRGKLVKRICNSPVRPPLRQVCSPGVRQVLPVSWHKNPGMRPSFATIVDQLRNHV